MKTKESWLPIPGYEGYYEVSSHGSIRSVDRVITAKNGTKRHHKSRLMALVRVGEMYEDGSQYIGIRLTRGCKAKMLSVHRTVAEAFVPRPSPEHCQVNHKDCDKTNNRADNLEWVTPAKNHSHAVANSRMNKRLSVDHYQIAKRLAEKGVYQHTIAYALGVNQSHISRMLRGETNAHFATESSPDADASPPAL